MDKNEEMTSVEETAEVEESSVSTTTSTQRSEKLVTLRRCLQAGCHYGHVTKRWNPKMAKFIYGARNGIYLIDLNKTVEQINIAYNALKRIVADGGKVLFVGTRDNAKELVQQEAARSGSFYISYRWLGGTLTNFSTIFNRIKYLRELNRQMNEGVFEKYSKKELSKINKKMDKLNKCLSGIVEMRKLPQALVVCDPTEECIAVKEAKKLNIPVFAICDTNADPDLITFPIPANDDSNESVKLIISLLGDAIVEARGADAFLYAYQPDQDPEATMKDAVIEADRIHREKLQIINAQRKERQERFEKMQQERFLKNSESKSVEKKEEIKTVEKKENTETKAKKEEPKIVEENKPVVEEPAKVEIKEEKKETKTKSKEEKKEVKVEPKEEKKEVVKPEPKKAPKKKEEEDIPHETVKSTNIKIEDIAKKSNEEIDDAVKSQFGVDITKLGIKENPYNIFYVTLKNDWRVLMSKVKPFKYFESQGDALLFAQALVNKFKGVLKCQNEEHKFVTASSIADLIEKFQKKNTKVGK